MHYGLNGLHRNQHRCGSVAQTFKKNINLVPICFVV